MKKTTQLWQPKATGALNRGDFVVLASSTDSRGNMIVAGAIATVSIDLTDEGDRYYPDARLVICVKTADGVNPDVYDVDDAMAWIEARALEPVDSGVLLYVRGDYLEGVLTSDAVADTDAVKGALIGRNAAVKKFGAEDVERAEFKAWDNYFEDASDGCEE